MLYGSIRRNLYARLAIHKMRWTLVFDYLFTPISTPKWHESIWFCMKFYEFTISKNLVTMRFYGLLLRYIDLWKKANLQRFPASFYQLPCSELLIFPDILPFSFFSYNIRCKFVLFCPIQHNIITQPGRFANTYFLLPVHDMGLYENNFAPVPVFSCQNIKYYLCQGQIVL